MRFRKSPGAGVELRRADVAATRSAIAARRSHARATRRRGRRASASCRAQDRDEEPRVGAARNERGRVRAAGRASPACSATTSRAHATARGPDAIMDVSSRRRCCATGRLFRSVAALLRNDMVRAASDGRGEILFSDRPRRALDSTDRPAISRGRLLSPRHARGARVRKWSLALRVERRLPRRVLPHARHARPRTSRRSWPTRIAGGSRATRTQASRSEHRGAKTIKGSAPRPGETNLAF